MPKTELHLAGVRHPLVLVPVGLLGAFTAMVATRAARGRSPLGYLVLGLAAFAVAGASALLGRARTADGEAASELLAATRRASSSFSEKVDRAVRSMDRPSASQDAPRSDRFPTLSPPPKPGATRPS